MLFIALSEQSNVRPTFQGRAYGNQLIFVIKSVNFAYKEPSPKNHMSIPVEMNPNDPYERTESESEASLEARQQEHARLQRQTQQLQYEKDVTEHQAKFCEKYSQRKY
uniref:MSP domain-containing protein n=1 Tax=Panagrellus redivivus TaxID=6233 RepID=A0A7E4VK83_PANRE